MEPTGGGFEAQAGRGAGVGWRGPVNVTKGPSTDTEIEEVRGGQRSPEPSGKGDSGGHGGRERHPDRRTCVRKTRPTQIGLFF